MEQTQVMIRVGAIVTGFNYRRRFDPTAMQELENDIKAHGGLIQPIAVRPLDDGQFQLIAGGRRVEAFKRAFGEDAQIPALCRVMTDAEATAAMVSENKQRQETTAIEDAEAATRMLGLCGGDKAETAKRLGWDIQLLTRRLAIMSAADAVRDAYIDDKIKLGHVEIFATMRREIQEQVLSKMLAAPAVPTVEQLKAMAAAVMLNLEAAIFDKQECTSCQFYTGVQQAMFETSFSGSQCTNKECYEKKTEVELEKRRVALTDTYPVVRIVRPGENKTVKLLKADGPNGVGAQQAAACRTCGDFGACVSATPDQLGKAFTEVCFNLSCNSEKIEARVKAEKAAQKAVQKTATPDDAKSTPGKVTSGSGETSAEKPAAEKKESLTVSSQPRNAIREYREKIWRLVFNRSALKLPIEKSRALLVAMCLYRPSTFAKESALNAISEATGQKLDNLTAVTLATQLLGFTKEQLSTALNNIPAFVGDDLDINAVVGFLTAMDVKIEDYWKVKAEFLELLTKVEVDAVCVEIGLDKAMGKDYAKLKNGPKGEFTKALMENKQFEFRGAVPKLMRW